MYKYESDLTGKEKRQIEIEKLKKMTFPEKMSHMWAYHKLILFLPLILIVLIAVIANMIENNRYKTVLSIGVIDSAMFLSTEDAAVALEELLGIDNKYSQIMIDNSFVTNGGELTAESVQKFTVVTAAKGMDILITTKPVYETYHDNGFFRELTDIFSQEELAAMNVVNNNAVDISGVANNEKFFGVKYDPAYFTVLVNVDLDEVDQDGVSKRDMIRHFFERVYQNK